MSITIRLINNDDLDGLKNVLDSIELFPSEMLDVMSSDYFENTNTEDIWFAALLDGKLVGIGYCAPEKLTDGTYNLYAIGVHAEFQSKGIGRQMMSFIEEYLKENKARLLIVDTSGTENFAATRKFYEGLGYTKEAVIKDFWAKNDDKVTFTKQLS